MEFATELNQLRSLPPQRLVELAGQLLPPWIALALVLAVGWQLSQLTWLLIPAGTPATVAMVSAVVSPEGGQTSDNIDIQSVVDAHLFGMVAGDTSAPIQPIDEPLKPTTLDLTLRGTITADDQAQSLAIIDTDRSEEEVYAVVGLSGSSMG